MISSPHHHCLASNYCCGPEKNNPYRVLGIDEKQNYGKFNFTGEKGKRKLTVEFFGVKGEKLGEWSINESELKYTR